MILTRQGKYGTYYGSPYDGTAHLTLEQMQVNAKYIYSYLYLMEWTLEAIAGMLGNMQHESAINPGRWEGDRVGTGPGYGLTQWTPYTKYTDWCAENGYQDPSVIDTNLARIIYELENRIQYYSTTSYPESFAEYTKSTKSPYYLACAFAWNYEKSAVVLWGANSKEEAESLTEEQKEANREALRQLRGGSAEYWYEFLSNVKPVKPVKKMPLWMYLRYD